MTSSLAGHLLREMTHRDDPVRSFLIASPDWDGKNDHALVTFTSEGVVLQGPLVIGTEADGMVSEPGKTLEWFEGVLTEDDVCGVFLHERWQHTVAERDLRVLAEREEYPPGKREFLLSLAEQLSQGIGSRESLVFALRTRGGIEPHLSTKVGVDYPMPEAGWLCAVQQKFAQLRRELS